MFNIYKNSITVITNNKIAASNYNMGSNFPQIRKKLFLYKLNNNNEILFTR